MVNVSLGNRKAPVMDGIPVEAIKTIAKERPFLLLNMSNTCLLAAVVSKRWKVQKLVLLDKGKGPPITPSSYRPLCMLDNLGMVFKKMLRARLWPAVDESGGLCENQHGFRIQRSTKGAIKEVFDALEHRFRVPLYLMRVIICMIESCYTRQRKAKFDTEMQISDEIVEAHGAVKYLGEVVDRKLTHWAPIRTAADNVAKMVRP